MKVSPGTFGFCIGMMRRVLRINSMMMTMMLLMVVMVVQ